jgi:hypothetical protein
MLYRPVFLLTIIAGFCGTLSAQNIQIKLGPDEIALNQMFTITLEVKNQRLQGYDAFPEIQGFRKMGTSSSSSTNIVNGQLSSSQSITQNYLPQQEGTFALKPFQMMVNEQAVQSPGKRIRVGPPAQQQQRSFDPFSADPFEDFFGKRNAQEFVDVKEDAFLALTLSKDEVYVGEGFTTTLGFYVAETNRADLSFYETGQQLADIKKLITPDNCWEENFNIERLNREDVIIGGKRYGRYIIFQATFFPFNTETIEFPAVPLKMIKYKVAKNPSFFGRNRQEDFKTFYSKPKSVRVKALPPHPLREQVAVGRYQLQEDISEQSLLTGQSFSYTFTVAGEGNISAIEKPLIRESEAFDFYPPNIRQNIVRSNSTVRGNKTFSYYGIPNEPGEYALGDYIQFIYFDPDAGQYDTLRSEFVVRAEGESKKNVTISSNDLGDFYNSIDLQNNRLSPNDGGRLIRLIANILVVVLLAISIYFIIKR